MYKAQPLDSARYANIYAMVQELSKKMNIPMPRLWLVNTPMANAFATGRNPSHASIAVTSGILAILDESELRGVLAHELSHIKNRDVLVSTIAATLATAIGYLANMLQYSAMWGSSSSNDNNRRTNPIVMVLVALLMPIAATLIQLAISRSREYMADETGAQTSQEPLALASALQKISDNVTRNHFDPRDASKASTASLFIVHPFTSGSWATLFATHPPIRERIERLKRLVGKRY